MAGSTIALRLGRAGVSTLLLEARGSLVDGPPMCHLHAGGALYPELSDADCRTLLRQSVETAAWFPESIDARPTLVCVPTRDSHDPDRLLAREQMLAEHYRRLVDLDPAHRVLGDPDDYVHPYTRARLEELAGSPQPSAEESAGMAWDRWVAPAATLLDLDRLRYPVLAIAEPNWNILRLAACVTLRLAALPTVDVRLHTRVCSLERDGEGWLVGTVGPDGADRIDRVDFVVNAAGFRAGAVDDQASVAAEHAVEFKAAWLARWSRPSATTRALPEIVVHGKRGTADGMAQFTPYGGDVVQLHGMVDGITLFDDEPATSTGASAQPDLDPEWVDWIDHGFDPDVALTRSRRAIDHVAPFLPSFADAQPLPQVLGGAQQVPGGDVARRVGRLRHEPGRRYAVAENAKACEAVDMADAVMDVLVAEGIVAPERSARPRWERLADADVTGLARRFARERGLPEAMAEVAVALPG